MSEQRINIFIESRFPANRKRIRQKAKEVLDEHKLIKEVEIDVAIVGDRKMQSLNKIYRNKDNTTPVLAFSQIANKEGDLFPVIPDKILRLGEVIISYPQSRELAREKNKLIDEVITDLLDHGIRQLLKA